MSTYSVVDGAQVSLKIDSADLSKPWDSTFEVRFPRGAAGLGELIDEMEVNSVGNHQFIVNDVLGASIAGTVAYKGGSLSVAHGASQGLMVWVGERYEIAAFTRSPTPTLKEAIRRFELFEINQLENGLAVTSRDRGHEIVARSARKLIPGVGVINVKNPHESVKMMPAWAGHKVRVGEVWRIDGAISADDQILVGAPTCAAFLSPISGSDFDSLVKFTSEITALEWRK